VLRCAGGRVRVTVSSVANNAQNTQVPLILTRPRRAAQAFYDGLAPTLRDRLRPVFSPLLDIVPVAGRVVLRATDAAIFTSANGVAHGPDGEERLAYCVGPATTAAAQDRGWIAHQVGVDAQSLIAGLITWAPDGPIYHLSGTHTRGNVAERLKAAGLNVTQVAVYDQRLVPLCDAACDVIRRENRVIVPLFSPRTAQQFANTAPRATSIHVVALSDAVAEAANGIASDRVRIASAPNASAMGDAIGDAL